MINKELKKIIGNDPKIEILKDYRDRRIPLWSNPRFNIDFFSKYSEQIENYAIYFKEQIILSLTGSDARKISKNLGITIKTLREYWKKLLDGTSLEEIIRKKIGNQGKLGLEFATCELKMYFNEYNKIPKTKDKGMIRIRNVVLSSDNWKKFGIHSWEDLLIHTFGKDFLDDWRAKKEKEKFENAISEFQKFNKKYNRPPKYEDKDTHWIASKISNGKFKKFGVSTWNNMLDLVFEEINLEQNKYTGKDGYKRAKKELIQFEKKYLKRPTAPDFDSMRNAIKRGEWEIFGITSWNDIMRDVFGEVNLELKYSYSDDQIFDLIVKKIKTFEKTHRRLPIVQDKEISPFSDAATRGKLERFGISSWDNLLIHIFGKANRVKHNLQGKNGLEKAIHSIKDYKLSYNNEPSVSKFDTIYRTAKDGKWNEFGINSWEDLLDRAFGKYNRDKNKYKDRQGLDRAINELKEFKEKNKKKPASNSKGIRRIYNTVSNGEWNEFGINNWKQLIDFVFKK